MVKMTTLDLLRDAGVTLGDLGENRQTSKPGPSTSAVLAVVASAVTLAAALIAVFGRVPLWVSGSLVALAAIAVAVSIGQHVADPLRRGLAGVRRRRLARRLVVQALELVPRIKGHMDLQRIDSYPAVLHGFGRSGLYADPLPNTFWITSTFRDVVTLLGDARSGRADPILSLTLFDRVLAAFHEDHVRILGERSAKLRDKLNDYQTSELRKARHRYEMLIEDYRKVGEMAERDLDLSMGMWCYNMPPYV